LNFVVHHFIYACLVFTLFNSGRISASQGDLSNILPLSWSLSESKEQQASKQASKQAVAYCWHSPAWLFLV
jgi:hypothetical protein